MSADRSRVSVTTVPLAAGSERTCNIDVGGQEMDLLSVAHELDLTGYKRDTRYEHESAFSSYGGIQQL